jgi:hypothetical protein
MPKETASFGGELGVVTLFDVGQLLLLNRATGRLDVESSEGRGTLFFRDGRIVNATDETHREGENIAYRIFQWKTGRFGFRAEPVGPTGSIEAGTEALMLEAARRQDEATTTPAESGIAARVRDRQSALEALREVFADVTSEARRFGDQVVSAPGQENVALATAGDRMVLRPGRPVRLRITGEWREPREDTMNPSEYEELKNRLLGPPGTRESSTRDPLVRYAMLNGKLRVAVTPIAAGHRESLWIRPVDLPAPDPRRLQGPEEMLTGVLGQRPAMILVAGADPDVASELLHALVALLIGRPNESLLLVSEIPVYRHADSAGVLAECAAAELTSALSAAVPGTLALDVGRAIPEDSFRVWSGVTRVLVATTGANAAEARARWRSRFGTGDLARLESVIAGWPKLLVTSSESVVGREAIPYSVWKLEEPSPRAATPGPEKRAA